MFKKSCIYHLFSGVVLIGIVFSQFAFSRSNCQSPNASGVQQCTVGISSNILNSSCWQSQREPLWCWAASIQMVFRYYGYEIQQPRIVQEAWGGVVNMPGTPEQIITLLNRIWTDDHGKKFQVNSDIYTANVITAAQDLAADKPLVIGTMGHAMLLSAMTYTNSPSGSTIIDATVRDPWPGKGKRSLTIQEWSNISFAARIEIHAIAETGNNSGEDSNCFDNCMEGSPADCMDACQSGFGLPYGQCLHNCNPNLDINKRSWSKRCRDKCKN